MKTKIFLLMAILVSAMALSPVLYAGAGSMGGGGMMGGQHGGIMGNSPGFTNPRAVQPRSDSYIRDSQPQRENETMRLRDEIREKRQELSELYRSETPDKELIDQKIEELSKLESGLDKRLSSY